ncbi:MAG: hypothetical protein MUP09_11165 [Thiovulaceae bacterium]|nr:hypothetical protein [Sulfurimonadaceae bacterium]
MAFVLELHTTSLQLCIKNYIVAIIREFDINTVIRQHRGKIICAFASEHPDLQRCLESIAQRLRASCFLTGSQHYEVEGETKAEHIVLCGSHFANHSLFSRVLRNLKQTPSLININYPIGKENVIVGGVSL